MKRNLILIALVAVGAFALAQGTTRVVGAEGRGVATNANNRNGEFRLDVRKFMRPNAVHLEGRFEWHEITPAVDHRFTVVMARPTEVSVSNDHKICEFSGPARLTRRGNSGPVVIEGRLVGRVHDRRRPDNGGTTGGTGGGDGANEPDLIRWQFVSPATNVGASFEGWVRQGDIRVFARVVGGNTTGGTTGGTSGGRGGN